MPKYVVFLEDFFFVAEPLLTGSLAKGHLTKWFHSVLVEPCETILASRRGTGHSDSRNYLSVVPKGFCRALLQLIANDGLMVVVRSLSSLARVTGKGLEASCLRFWSSLLCMPSSFQAIPDNDNDPPPPVVSYSSTKLFELRADTILPSRALFVPNSWKCSVQSKTAFCNQVLEGSKKGGKYYY